MPVYMIRAGEDGPVKIGITSNVGRRIAKMQSDSPTRLTLMRLLDGDAIAEAKLHSRFADYRTHGEWFTYTSEMLDDVGVPDLVPPQPPGSPTPVDAKWTGNPREYIKKIGIKQRDIAQVLGVGEPAVSLWFSRRADIPTRFIVPLAECLRVDPKDVLEVAIREEPA